MMLVRYICCYLQKDECQVANQSYFDAASFGGLFRHLVVLQMAFCCLLVDKGLFEYREL